MTRPIESSFKLPAVAWPPVDFGGCIAVLAARRQMVLLYGLARTTGNQAYALPENMDQTTSRWTLQFS